MPILHMETDLVRGTGYLLQQTSGTLLQQSHQLTYSVQDLASVWQSHSATIFIDEIQLVLHQLNQFADAVRALDHRLQHEVDEWERVANEFGTSVFSPLLEENGQIQGSAPWFNSTQERLTWLKNQSIWAEIGVGLYGLQGLSFALGATYTGQVLVYGSRFQKELVGLSGHLTHLKGAGMPTHIFRQAGKVTKIDAAFAFLRVAPQWMSNYREYGGDPAKFAVAHVVDTLAIAGVGLGAAYIGGAGGAKLGGIVGFAVGGPVGAAAGAVIGGVAGKIIAGWTADALITEPFMDSTMRHDAINFGTDLWKDTGSTMKNSFDTAATAIQEIDLPEFKFTW